MLAILLAASALQPVGPDGKASSPSLPPPPAAVSPADTVQCRTQKVLGSRLGGTRVCLTKSQWAAQELAERQTLREAQQRGFQNNPQVGTIRR